MRPPRRRRQPSDTVRSGPDRDARDPALVGEALTRLLAERGWDADVAVGSVTGRWPQIVGPDVAAHVRPVSFEAGVLTVQADSTAWATQMRLLGSSLLGRVAEEVGAGTVTDLVVLGPAAPRWARGPRRVAGRGPRDTFG
jgi:predicted nucleic acid-binding Zn ribbon protein